MFFQKIPCSKRLAHQAQRYTTYGNHGWQMPISRSSSDSTSILPVPFIKCTQKYALERLDANDPKVDVSVSSRVLSVAVGSESNRIILTSYCN